MGQLLSLDFDGVMNSYASGWIKEDPTHLPDPAVPGTFDFIKQAQQHFDVVVHSSRLRFNGGEDAIKVWSLRELEKEGWTPSRAADLVGHLQFSLEKPPAHVSLDDRAIQFNGFYPKLDEIIDFRPWNKRNNLIAPKVPGIHTRWRHTNGNIYKVLLVSNLHSDREDKFPVTVVYEGVTNKRVWSRPLSRWYSSFVAID